MTGRRIASIWFPRFAIQRWAKANPCEARAGPAALVSEGTHGIAIDAINAGARHGGARRGQRLADARAALPSLAAWPSDKPGDADALERLRGWAERWSPFVAVDGADALLLDLTGVAHLFGGEAALAAEMRARFRAAGLTARVAIAPTVGAAWALARHGEARPALCADTALAEMLAPLPVEALRLDEESVLLLGRLGLKTIGALAAIPQLALARRFARPETAWADPPLRLAQAFGRRKEPLSPILQPPVPRVVRRVAEPVLHIPVLAPLVAAMADALCRRLAEEHRGARHLLLQAFRVDGEVQALEARTSRPMRDPAHMLRLFEERFESLDAGFGFDALALTALWHEPLDAAQAGLIEPEHDHVSIDRLIDRLSARLGTANISVPDFVESHLPERAIGWRPALGANTVPGTPVPTGPARPIRLLDRPEPISVTYATPQGDPKQIIWRRRTHRIVRAQGPERIAPEWWRSPARTRLRDYYRVEDEAGQRYWIYRYGVENDGRGGTPDWFIHGIDA